MEGGKREERVMGKGNRVHGAQYLRKGVGLGHGNRKKRSEKNIISCHNHTEPPNNQDKYNIQGNHPIFYTLPDSPYRHQHSHSISLQDKENISLKGSSTLDNIRKSTMESNNNGIGLPIQSQILNIDLELQEILKSSSTANNHQINTNRKMSPTSYSESQRLPKDYATRGFGGEIRALGDELRHCKKSLIASQARASMNTKEMSKLQHSSKMLDVKYASQKKQCIDLEDENKLLESKAKQAEYERDELLKENEDLRRGKFSETRHMIDTLCLTKLRNCITVMREFDSPSTTKTQNNELYCLILQCVEQLENSSLESITAGSARNRSSRGTDKNKKDKLSKTPDGRNKVKCRSVVAEDYKRFEVELQRFVENRIREMRAAERELQTKIAEVTEESMLKSNQIQDFLMKVEKYKTEVNKMRESFNLMRDKIKELKDEIEVLREKSNQVNSTLVSPSSLKETLTDLESKLSIEKKDKHYLLEQLDSYQSTINNQQGIIKELKSLLDLRHREPRETDYFSQKREIESESSISEISGDVLALGNTGNSNNFEDIIMDQRFKEGNLVPNLEKINKVPMKMGILNMDMDKQFSPHSHSYPHSHPNTNINNNTPPDIYPQNIYSGRTSEHWGKLEEVSETELVEEESHNYEGEFTHQPSISEASSYAQATDFFTQYLAMQSNTPTIL